MRFRSRHLCAEHLFPLLSKQGMIHAWLKIVSGLPAISVLSSPPQLLFPPLPFTGATRTATAEAGKPMCDVDRSNHRSGGARVSDRASDGAASVVVRAPLVGRPPLSAATPPARSDMADCRLSARLGRKGRGGRRCHRGRKDGGEAHARLH